MKQIFTITLIFYSLLVSHQLYACKCAWIDRQINSLQELEEYNFIAHVLILENKGNQSKFEIKELFKGKHIDKFIEPARESSCGYGIDVGEEWIIFGKANIKGTLIASCDRNVKYRDIRGLRNWKYERGIAELRQLQKLYGKEEEVFSDGLRQEYYTHNQIEIQENWKNGHRHGERKIWYPNGKPYCQQNYVHGVLDGKSVWYYPSGQIYDEEFYDKGKSINVSRLYYDSNDVANYLELMGEDLLGDSVSFDPKKLHPHYEHVYDADGRSIISREYSVFGKLKSETIHEPDHNYRTEIRYYENGLIESISYYLNNTEIRPTQRFNENGLPEKPVPRISISDQLDPSIPIQAKLLTYIQDYEQDPNSVLFIINGIPSKGLSQVNDISPEQLKEVELLDEETALYLYKKRAEGKKTILITAK